MAFRFLKTVFSVFAGLFTISSTLFAQGISIGSWRTHVSYADALYLSEAENKIWVAGRYGMYTVNKNDFSIERLSKEQGFSDILSRRIEYNSNPKYKALFIAYNDASIDIVRNNQITALNDLRNAGINTIYDFYFSGKYCYIAHNEGITEYNLDRSELAETYRAIGQPSGGIIKIYSVTIHSGYLYAATEFGVQRGLLSSILNSHNSWTSISNQSAKYIVTFADKVWAVFQDNSLKYFDGTNWIVFDAAADVVSSLEVNHGKIVLARSNKIILIDEQLNKTEVGSNSQNHAIIDSDAYIWLAKNTYATMRLDPANNKADFIAPNGPIFNEVYRAHNWGKEMWFTSGGLNDFGSPHYRNLGFYSYINDNWVSYNSSNVSNWINNRDISDIETDPRTGRKWISSLDAGVIEYDPQSNRVLKLFNANNSALANQNVADTNTPVTAIVFDGNNNMWMTNYRAQKPLVVRTATGQWYNFQLGSKNWVTDVIADDYNNIWVLASRQSAIYVFNPGLTINNPNDGDQVKELSTASGGGALPSLNVNAIAKDKEGQIWLGTGDGIVVFAEPSLLFSQYNFDAQRPWVENGDESGYLLAGEQVISLAVDGGNRKWIGTRNGIWLVSEDGSKILQHYNTKNSPLASNIVSFIEINDETGEVFFVTDKGVFSYRGTATEGADKHGDVYAFPNPVKPGYDGPIAITGLVRDARVKITDVSGKLVYETIAEGGQAIWNGKNFSGEAAQSGVYLVFSASADGQETAVTKILIVR